MCPNPLPQPPPTAPALGPSRVRRPAVSYELFPARGDQSFDKLRHTVAELEATAPDYVSVTCASGRTNLNRMIELVDHLLWRTRLRPLVHLTCVGSTPQALEQVVRDLLGRGVRGILALRGDTPSGYSPDEDEFPFARYLVELIRRVEREETAALAAGRLAVGVAAYAQKHPESPSLRHDVEVLLSKERSGADFAITQVFFNPLEYTNLVSRARRAGVTIPIIPGFVPMTSVRRLTRLAELSGVHCPDQHLHALEVATSDAQRRRIGVRATVELARAALDAGAPGIHLFTFNEHADALDVLDQLDLSRYRAPALAV
ncbi:methylenetetrahydrofolate reductase [Devriesea agamarum]|uniref:methylenetetrahydrofolate reductase n=1 Tax=Devriesea agamarum TaxID=472569 RepID=UPI0008356E70|nr:methylenetetrahydrofolate reductase [Devriesea agamarum]